MRHRNVQSKYKDGHTMSLGKVKLLLSNSEFYNWDVRMCETFTSVRPRTPTKRLRRIDRLRT